MDKGIYLIEKIFIDGMENKIELAIGYEVFGYIQGTEDIAKNFCNDGKIYTSRDCWAIEHKSKSGSMPEFRYTKLEKIISENNVWKFKNS